MMEAAVTSETSVNFFQTARRNIPEDSHLYTRRRENLKSHDDLLCPYAAFPTLHNDQRVAEAPEKTEDYDDDDDEDSGTCSTGSGTGYGTEHTHMIWDSAPFTVSVEEQVVGVPEEDRGRLAFTLTAA
jgi:hypothetical protein